ncbi:MAG: Zn-dependent alcohol dehydrogenase [Deltaproteobacteria bacterium]|nr:Zn-dependent alcohol dehydrogenase [Deltaproteobacteria bacterium]
MKAKAAILFEVGKRLEIREIDVEPPRAGEVLIKMAAGGVCHSDLHVMTGHLAGPIPSVLGHEGSGVIAEVGPGVTSLKPGDHVIPLWRLSCGVCEFCSDSRPALCPEGSQVRSTGRFLDGTTRFKLNGMEIKHFAGVSSFSEYSVMPARAVLKIPNDFPLDKAALLGCGVITGVGAVFNAARVKPGSSVVVFGCGGVGINCIQGAAIAGAEKVIAVDKLPNKLQYAKTFGATHTIDASKGNPVEQVRALTGGRGVDYAFEVIGLPAVIRQAYDCLCKRGVCVVVGVAPMTMEVSVPIMTLVFEEKVLTGSVYGSARPWIDIPMLMRLYQAGKLKLDELLTRKYPFAQINEAYEALERGEVLRSIVTF